VTVPDILNKTIEEAEKILKENNLEIHINNETEEMDKSQIIVNEQIPQAGVTVYEGSKVYVN